MILNILTPYLQPKREERDRGGGMESKVHWVKWLPLLVRNQTTYARPYWGRRLRKSKNQRYPLIWVDIVWSWNVICWDGVKQSSDVQPRVRKINSDKLWFGVHTSDVDYNSKDWELGQCKKSHLLDHLLLRAHLIWGF